MDNDLQTTLLVALRQLGDERTTDLERDCILSAVASHFIGVEAETAVRVLHHRREARSLQMELVDLIDRKRCT